MLDTMTRYLAGMAAEKDRRSLRYILEPIVDGTSTQMLSTAGLLISAGGATTVKTGSADAYASVVGTLVRIPASTTLPVLVGSITAGAYNVFCFFVDSAGNLTSAMGTQGAAVGNVVFPPIPKNKAMLGFIIVTYASAFTGGTTALDTATTVYINVNGDFNPTVLI